MKAKRQEENNDSVNDNVVDMRLAKPTEPRLTFLFQLTQEDELFWGIPEDLNQYATNLDISMRLLGCKPDEVGNWLRLINQYVPADYVKHRGVCTAQGLIELFQLQWCVSSTVPARGEDWDIVVALGLDNGVNLNICSKRELLKDSKGRVINIPNMHPVEFHKLTAHLAQEHIARAEARVKLNPYKVGLLRYEELLRLRWTEYQTAAKAEEVINLDFCAEPTSFSSSLATYNPQAQRQQRTSYQQVVDVSEIVPIEEMSQTIRQFKLTGNSVDDIVKEMEVKNFQQGIGEGYRIRWARYAGMAKGAEAADETGREMLEP